jgi:hypothetical protein
MTYGRAQRRTRVLERSHDTLCSTCDAHPVGLTFHDDRRSGVRAFAELVPQPRAASFLILIPAPP